jgi:iron-sulfur cluster protein
MEDINDFIIHPSQVADKSIRDSIPMAIDLALNAEVDALRHNTQTFNSNRYKALYKLEDYELLKEQARAIKEKSIERLPELINKLSETIRKRGGVVYLAKTKEEAVDYIKTVCLEKHAKLVVKSKSITSEEIGLNAALEGYGIEVSETDLAEFILQLSKEQPSHIVAPAIHRTRESISELFKRHFNTNEPLETGEQLTEFARRILRKKFLTADIGISGANLISANEGAILLVESEGNIKLTTQLPAIHISICGVEKIIPSRTDFGIFVELLAASGTGQTLTSYTNVIEPPTELPILNLNGRQDFKREFHLVLVDNGRMIMRADEQLKESLYCIRCSACMNSCANFQTVGGHAFGGECYTGGIGGAWTIGTTGILEKGSFAEFCTGCSRCIPNCPVKIDIPGLNTIIKSRLIESSGKVGVEKRFFAHFSKIVKIASLAPSLFNNILGLGVAKLFMEKTTGVDHRRKIPRIAKKTLEKQFMNSKLKGNLISSRTAKLVLFADVYTNYNNPEVGIAALRVFNKLGFDVTLSEVISEGRATQSQGLLKIAKHEAHKVISHLSKFLDDGYIILVVEPSVLSMFRSDYKKLIDNDSIFQRLSKQCFDPIEFLNYLILKGELHPKEFIIRDNVFEKKVFYHPHCQMKSVGASEPNIQFFNRLGMNIEVSTVECCGMAGSFGYKKKFYNVSKSIGEDLINQIFKKHNQAEAKIILASGTSCREQIKGLTGNEVLHPIQFLENILIHEFEET